MTTRMKAELPLDILHYLGETINCRATLAALCRASKELNRIFTPLLYRKLHVQDCEYALLERLTNYRDGSFKGSNPNLRFTKELRIGRDLRNYPSTVNATQDEQDALTIGLKSMPNLASLSLNIDIDLFHTNRGGRDWRLGFALLQCPETVRDLYLAGSRHCRSSALSLRGFQNLNKLVLCGVKARSSADEWINDIVSILFRSVGLRSLGFSLMDPDDDEDQRRWLGPYARSGCLLEICRRYHAARENREAPLLRLTELELGNGYLPPPMDPSAQTPDAQHDYVSLLTDLSTLRTLKIQNFVKNHWDFENAWNNQIRNSYATTLHFHAPLFYNAENLVKLSATKLTSDVIHLINHIRKVNPSSNLSSIEFGGNCPSPDIITENLGANAYEEFLVRSMHSAGFHWRSLDISDVDTSSSHLIAYLKHCRSLEELACGMSERRLELFKQKVLPRLESLHTLIIGNIQTDNLVDQLFPNSIPGIKNVDFDIKAEAEAKKSKSLFKSFKGLSVKSESRNEWREELKLRQEEAGAENFRQDIALDLFKVSWKAWERRKDGEKGAKLKYVGLGYRVYTSMLPGPGERGKQDKWKVFRLSHDEAMEFGAVRKLLSEDP